MLYIFYSLSEKVDFFSGWGVDYPPPFLVGNMSPFDALPLKKLNFGNFFLRIFYISKTVIMFKISDDIFYPLCEMHFWHFNWERILKTIKQLNN